MWRSADAVNGVDAVVAGASCFVHTAWAATWLPTLRAAGPLVVLVDVEAERFVGSWVDAGLAVRAGTMRIQDSTGVYWATGLRVGDDTSLWLHLADETTVKLLLDQLRHTAGLDLREDVARLADWMEVLSSTITHPAGHCVVPGSSRSRRRHHPSRHRHQAPTGLTEYHGRAPESPGLDTMAAAARVCPGPGRRVFCRRGPLMRMERMLSGMSSRKFVRVGEPATVVLVDIEEHDLRTVQRAQPNGLGELLSSLICVAER